MNLGPIIPNFGAWEWSSWGRDLSVTSKLWRYGTHHRDVYFQTFPVDFSYCKRLKSDARKGWERGYKSRGYWATNSTKTCSPAKAWSTNRKKPRETLKECLLSKKLQQHLQPAKASQWTSTNEAKVCRCAYWAIKAQKHTQQATEWPWTTKNADKI